MLKISRIIFLLLLPCVALLITACPKSVDERIRENVRVPGLEEGVQARDRSLETAVLGNINSDIELRWYLETYGYEVNVSHTVATVTMKVKTQDQHDRAIELAKSTQGITDVTDNIEIDPNLDDAPFSEIW
jgi:osmotically-inducible protein OsmY